MKMRILTVLLCAVALVACFSSFAMGSHGRLQKTNGTTRELLVDLNDLRLDSDKLGTLFRVGDNRIADLIELLDDPDPEVSLRAQMVIRYLSSEEGKKALRVWYRKQRNAYRIAGPISSPLDEWDYNNIHLNLLNESPRTWGTDGVKYIYALTLDKSSRAQSLLTELICKARTLEGTSFLANAIRRIQSTEPTAVPVQVKELANVVLNNGFLVAPEDRDYATARVLATSGSGDKALIVIYVNRGVLAEEWYHVVLRRYGKAWTLVSVTPIAVS